FGLEIRVPEQVEAPGSGAVVERSQAFRRSAVGRMPFFGAQRFPVETAAHALFGGESVEGTQVVEHAGAHIGCAWQRERRAKQLHFAAFVRSSLPFGPPGAVARAQRGDKRVRMKSLL